MVRTKDSSIRTKIIVTAADLFYRNGYRATGVNEVIKKSGVAKATFYSHFPSKQDLCLAYVQYLAEADLIGLEDALSQIKDPKIKLIRMFEMLEGWLESSEFKGCGFLNLIPEITDANSPIRKEGVSHYDLVRGRIEAMLKEVKRLDPKKYKDLDPSVKAKEVMVLFAGAIAMSEIYGETWPVKSALSQIKGILN